MTKKQAERYMNLRTNLLNMGFKDHEINTLLRAQKTLHTWDEHECNGVIQRDEDTNKPYWYNADSGKKICPAPDRESGAMKRVEAIAAKHGVTAYHQCDPRGCSLYLVRSSDVPAGAGIGGYYSRGIALCID